MKPTTTIGLLTGLFAPTVPVVHAGNCMTCHGGSDEWVAATMPELPQLTDADARGQVGSGLLNVCWYAWQND